MTTDFFNRKNNTVSEETSVILMSNSISFEYFLVEVLESIYILMSGFNCKNIYSDLDLFHKNDLTGYRSKFFERF